MTVIDLNCDVGELEDAALEAALMEFITSANIACGGHAGDERSMERVARLAIARGVRIGAHPGYPDRENFGRLEMDLLPAELETLVLGQIARLETVVRRLGGEIVHVKPHGALYNSAAKDAGIARAIGSAVARWNPGAVLFGMAGSTALSVWREMGIRIMAEGFADRRYEPDGSLRPRRFAGALITDPAEAADQAARLASEGVVQTICVHSDTPGAPGILRACRESLSAVA